MEACAWPSNRRSLVHELPEWAVWRKPVLRGRSDGGILGTQIAPASRGVVRRTRRAGRVHDGGWSHCSQYLQRQAGQARTGLRVGRGGTPALLRRHHRQTVRESSDAESHPNVPGAGSLRGRHLRAARATWRGGAVKIDSGSILAVQSTREHRRSIPPWLLRGGRLSHGKGFSALSVPSDARGRSSSPHDVRDTVSRPEGDSRSSRIRTKIYAVRRR